MSDKGFHTGALGAEAAQEGEGSTRQNAKAVTAHWSPRGPRPNHSVREDGVRVCHLRREEVQVWMEETQQWAPWNGAGAQGPGASKWYEHTDAKPSQRQAHAPHTDTHTHTHTPLRLCPPGGPGSNNPPVALSTPSKAHSLNTALLQRHQLLGGGGDSRAYIQGRESQGDQVSHCAGKRGGCSADTAAQTECKSIRKRHPGTSEGHLGGEETGRDS